jgi:subtilisin-like proprotein convertase family protein
VIGQDPVVNTVYMGDYDQVASSGGGSDPVLFSATWADNRLGNAFHAHQPDVRFARIAGAPVDTDLQVTATASPGSVLVGDDSTITVEAFAVGGDVADVYLHLSRPAGVAFMSVVGPQCTQTSIFIDCYLGPIADGTSKAIEIVTRALATGTKHVTASATTSSHDTNDANNTDTATLSVSAGTGASATYSTGNIAVPIPDLSTIEVPITVPDEGVVVNVVARVRLNHTFDSDLTLTLVAPTGETVALANRRGGSGDNYGTGANSCSGTRTTFSDAFSATPISAGVAPFAGQFNPEEPFAALVGLPTDGLWKLRITDAAGGDTGTVGCVQLVITRD